MFAELNKSFKDATKKQLNENSQLNQFKILEILENKEKLFNIWRTYKLENKFRAEYFSFEIYIVKENAFWENIAYEIYGRAEYWWVLAFFNNIRNPFESLYPGQTLLILKRDQLYIFLEEVSKFKF